MFSPALPPLGIQTKGYIMRLVALICAWACLYSQVRAVEQWRQFPGYYKCDDCQTLFDRMTDWAYPFIPFSVALTWFHGHRGIIYLELKVLLRNGFVQTEILYESAMDWLWLNIMLFLYENDMDWIWHIILFLRVACIGSGTLWYFYMIATYLDWISHKL